MRKLASAIDRLTDCIGYVTGLALFVLGFLISFEVVMRYVFNSPTIWVGEVSLQIQIWMVFLAASYVLKKRDMVTIEVILSDHTSVLRKLAETLGLIVLFIMTLPAIWYGFEIWLRATKAGHTTDTFLGLPRFFTDASIWLGFSFLSLQALVELWRIWAVGIPASAADIVDSSH